MAWPIPSTERRRGRGFTLAEAMIASVILSLAVMAGASAFSASYDQERDLNQNATALAVARQLMELILAKPYDDVGPNTQLDCIRDYQGYSDQVTSLKTLDGTQTVNLGGAYQRKVDIVYRNTLGGTPVTFGDFGLLTVTVTSPGGRVVKLSQLVTNVAVADR